MATVKYTLSPKNPPKMTDAEKRAYDENHPIDYSDIPELGDDFFATAQRASDLPVKQQLTVRLDTDVLEWLKGMGKGYQTRINRILRAAMESQQHDKRPR